MASLLQQELQNTLEELRVQITDVEAAIAAAAGDEDASELLKVTRRS
jgi:hypothetical protein